MKVLVCGSRHFNDYELLRRTLDEIHTSGPIKEIIEGEAKGADRLSVEWAVQNDVPTKRFPANWDVHGKRAGPIRNHQMLKEGKPDMAVAFWDGKSSGTGNMIDIAQEAGLPVKIVEIS